METIPTGELKTIALERGADMIGIASIDRFEGAPRRYHPGRFLPDARSVVVIGNRILRGLAHGVRNNIAYLPQTFFGQGWLSNVKVNLSVFDAARWIEDQGYHAVPLPWPDIDGRMAYLRYLERHGGELDSDIQPQDTPDWPGETFISFKMAAVAAGLGELGWNRMLLTPQFGPRNRIDVIVTNAPFAADPIYQGRLCDAEDCGYRCVKICPPAALSARKSGTIEVGGRTFEVSAFHEVKCAWVLAGLTTETCSFAPYDNPVPDDPKPSQFLEAKERAWAESPVYNRYDKLASMGAAFCSRCQMVCSDYLEKSGKVQNLFEEE